MNEEIGYTEQQLKSLRGMREYDYETLKDIIAKLEKENRELKKYVCINRCIHRNKGEYEDKHYICPQCENEETSESAKFCKICGLKIEKGTMWSGEDADYKKN